MIASELCIKDLVINIYRAIRPQNITSESTPTYFKPIVEYMSGYKPNEVEAALQELIREELIISSSDDLKNDIVIIDFTTRGYSTYHSLFAMIDESDLWS